MRVGANVQPGQLVEVLARVEHAPVARAVTRAAYKAGARYVDVYYSDQHIRRALIEGAADELLSWTPPWLLKRSVQVGDERAAVIALTGDAEPNLLADLPGDRVGKARMLELAEESNRQINEQLNNWTVIGVPNVGWAEQMFGEPDLERLWKARRVQRAAGRGRSGRRVARTRRAHRQARTDAERPRGRLDPLHRTGHRPARRTAARVALAGLRVADRSRPSLRREHADGGGLHDAGPAPHGGLRPLDAPTRAVRPDRQGARGSVRRRPHRRREGRRGRRRRPGAARDRRHRGLPRRDRAGRRHLAHRPDGADVLRHALRREHDLPRRLRRRVCGGGRGRRDRGRQRLERAHRLHGRRARGRRRRRHAQRHRGAAAP